MEQKCFLFIKLNRAEIFDIISSSRSRFRAKCYLNDPHWNSILLLHFQPFLSSFRVQNTKRGIFWDTLYVAFFLWCKNDSSIFSVSKAFLKECPMILIMIPEQKKWNCLHYTSPTLQNYDLFIPFLSFLARQKKADPDPGSGPGKNMRIRADPDPKHWKNI